MKCTRCGGELREATLFCPNCGMPTESQSTSALPLAPPCVCGRVLTARDLFCPSCGRSAGQDANSGLGGFPPPGHGPPYTPPAGPYGSSAGSYSPYTQAIQPYLGPYLPAGASSYALTPYRRRNRVAAGLLGIFLGAIGIHRFYLGQIGWGLAYLFLCWTGIPWIVGFVEGIVYLCQSDESFNLQYN